jgi:TnpA family transposase
VTLEYLSDDQVARYGRFAQEPSPQELEAFFRLDESALEIALTKRRPHNRLGWAVQWGTVRMLGAFVSRPSKVPPKVAAFVADQLGIDDPSLLAGYPDRQTTQYEHAKEIRSLLGVRDFEDGELELRQHIAGRVWMSNEGPRALFGRTMFFGRLGEVRHAYRDGMENQLGALGMALNSVIFWNSLYIDAAVRELEAGGLTVSPEIRSRLSPLIHDHINFHGRYPIVRSHPGQRLRPLRDPRAEHDAG